MSWVHFPLAGFHPTLIGRFCPTPEDSRDGYFNLLLLSTVVVAIGVVMEGPQVFEDIQEEIERFWHGRPRLEIDKRTHLPVTRHRFNWKKMIESLGWLLVAVGVCGEFALDSLVSQSDRQLQTFDNTVTGFEIAAANERAATAMLQAGDVADKAKELGVLLTDERRRSTEAESKLSGATGRLQTVLTQLSEVQTREELLSQRRRPRAELLRDRLSPTDSRLVQFGRQRIIILNCDALLMSLYPNLRPEVLSFRRISGESACGNEEICLTN
jgi:hypothetical protein